jgi:hypothetical protein
VKEAIKNQLKCDPEEGTELELQQSYTNILEENCRFGSLGILNM